MLNPFKSSALSQLIFLLNLLGHAAAALDKPLIKPAIPGLDDGLKANLPLTDYTVKKWEYGPIPDRCRDIANNEKYSPYDIEVYSVKYPDCGSDFVMCRHKNSEATSTRMFNIFGRLPVHMRQWVRTLLVFPGNPSRHAYTFSDLGDNVLFGDVQNWITIWVHEIAHTLDYNAVKDYPKFSTTNIWKDAYNKDKAISDYYAATNQAENFAQETVIALFDKVVPNGGISTVEPNWQDIKNQFQTVQKNLGNILERGGKCNFRFKNADVVCMGPKAPCGQANARMTSPEIAVDESIPTLDVSGRPGEIMG